VATQGASENPVPSSPSEPAAVAAPKSTDVAKESELRSLLDLLGTRGQVADVAASSAAQYRERLLSRAPKDEKNQALVRDFAATYQKDFDNDRAMRQIAGIYDKHYTEEEIRYLLQFFESPVGRKFAAESPKIASEMLVIREELAAKAARDSLQDLEARNPELQARAVTNARKLQPPDLLEGQTKEVSERHP
jgi:hypothetical protein